MTSPIRRRLVLVGLGLHARRNHYPLLARLCRDYDLELVALIERESALDELRPFLDSQTLKPERVLVYPGAEAFRERLPEALCAELSQLLSTRGFDGLVISTDPRSHRMYMEWAARHGIDVVVDKPITARPLSGDDASARQLLDDFVRLERAFTATGADATVLVSRRAHPGYVWIRDYLQDFVERTSVPITYLDSYFAYACWNLPDEFFWRENHPYRYGYGALLHGGYHALDLACWLLGVNAALDAERRPDRLELMTRHVTPADLFKQVPATSYERFFGDGNLRRWMDDEHEREAAAFGETDACLLFQLFRDERVITTGSIEMLETAFCLRSWRDLPRDTYKGNGRVTRERLTVQVGHLLSIETEDLRGFTDGSQEPGAPPNQFLVRVYRNERLIGGPRFQELAWNPSDGSDRSLCDEGRERLFRAWIERRPTGSSLSDHRLTAEVLAAAYRSMARQRRGRAPLARIQRGAGLSDQRPYVV